MRLYRLVLLMVICTVPAVPAGRWRLVWSDEFNGPENAALDPSKWTYDLGGGGWGNNELETYTNSAENVAQDGQGHLAIRAVKTASGGYTSARIKTQGLFNIKFGKIEAKIKVPFGQGIWPAFWMLGSNIEAALWPGCGEVDIMENIGKEPSIIHGTAHGPGYSGGAGISGKYELTNHARFTDDFHVFAVEWSPGRVRFLVDDTLYFEVTPSSLPLGAPWVFDHPFFLLLNVGVGGDWPRYPDATSVFPQTMSVDWVRVWQQAPVCWRPAGQRRSSRLE